MSLIKLLDRALSVDLSKSEHRAFLALLRQTLGFNKTNDALTSGRIAQITGLRKDHAKKALTGVVDAGLFERSPHSIYEYTYAAAVQEASPAPTKPAPAETDPTKPVPAPALAELTIDEVIDDETRSTLARSLSTLRTDDAQAVCDLLAQAIKNGSIQTTPIRFAGALIRAARFGTLDKSSLKKQQQPLSTPPAPQKSHADFERKAQEGYYRQVAALLGKSIDDVKRDHGVMA